VDEGADMRPVVLYIDDHRGYQSRLSRRLRSLSDGAYEVISIGAEDAREKLSAVDAFAQETLRRIVVSIAPQSLPVETTLAHLHALALHINLCESENKEGADTPSCLSRECPAERDCNVRTDNLMRAKPLETLSVSRFVRASHMDAIIRRYLTADNPSLSTGTQCANSIGTHLSFSHEAGTRVTRYVIGREQSLGHTVIYLPIKPLYQIENSFRRGHGLTFGDLIYRFSVGDIPEVNDMGRWLYMHEDGYYTCSMPERSDDMITCDIGTLRQITHAWREYTHTRSQPTTLWVDMEGLPLGDILSLSVLCDFIYVDAPVGNSDKELVAQRELGLFLAKLPHECRILELPHRRQTLKEIDHITYSEVPGIASEL
jgi:hypothetical protein